ncbi:hybrid sensor histidine kinase/response regulator [Rhizobacter sp. SG703]|uniref:hybrid sensor histidine kinase/response regulator n=1 Tax=Rhizobacter sp. SG703 TaxID=2587140 RepID=UPI00144674CD|nr:hybrid sensor histidine kinase/response regulator [Rhizobacter sp. SG703]NKI96948.1 signal transduction histidine kinase [Rhizobacter sp. SG703]
MLAPVKCLLVDDLEENLLALSALLRGEGVELLQARSGAQALELLLVHDVALALLDVQMPEMDGFQLAELMRGSERTRHVPIIFVTAGGRDQQRIFKGYESGAVDFLFKPIEAHILRNKAEVFFQLYRQKQQLAHELRERTETLRLNEMFVAMLGHDLRNPLNAIMTSATLLQRRAPDDVTGKTAGRILQGGRRMSAMIENMLDLARGRLAGGIAVQREPADLGPIVERVLQELQAALPEARIVTRRSGDLTGEWDAERLSQVVANLVGNALQHGEPGEAVDLVLDGDDPAQLTLVVANAGCIAPELLPSLFDPFRGGERPRGRSEGLGLGLYIVQQIVLAHGGRVDVEPCGDSNRTVFTVVLPRRIADGGTLRSRSS